MPDPIFRYCPLCATELIEQDVAGACRPVCPQCGFIQFRNPKIVAVTVVQYGDKLLLGRRNIQPGLGLWNFCGGYVDFGESLEEAAIREVKEEANLDVQLERLIGIYSEHGNPHILVAYLARVSDEQISSLAPQPEEVSELGFFGWEDLPEVAFPVHHRILRDWKKLNNG